MSATKKIFLYGTPTVATLIAFLLTLTYYGVYIQGDVNEIVKCAGNADEPCVSYFNISLSEWRLCGGRDFNLVLNDTDDVTAKIYKADKRYRSDNPARWKEYDFLSGCLQNGTLHEFKLEVYKPIDRNVKWGVTSGAANLDPVFLGYTKDSFFPKLEFVSNGIVNGTMGINFTNPTSFPIPLKNLTYTLALQKNLDVKQLDISVVRTRLSNYTRESKTPIIKTVFNENGTKMDVITGYTTESIEYSKNESIWESIAEEDVLFPGNSVIIVYSGKWKAGLGFRQIDVRQTVKVSGVSFIQDRDAVWSTNYTFKINATCIGTIDIDSVCETVWINATFNFTKVNTTARGEPIFSVVNETEDGTLNYHTLFYVPGNMSLNVNMSKSGAGKDRAAFWIYGGNNTGMSPSSNPNRTYDAWSSGRNETVTWIPFTGTTMFGSDSWSHDSFNNWSHYLLNDGHQTADTTDIIGKIKIVYNQTAGPNSGTLFLGCPLSPTTSSDGCLVIGTHPNIGSSNYACYDGAFVSNANYSQSAGMHVFELKKTTTKILGIIDGVNVCNQTSASVTNLPGIKLYNTIGGVTVDEIMLFRQNESAINVTYGQEINIPQSVSPVLILQLDGLSVNKSYELGTIVNISVSGTTDTVCITLDKGIGTLVCQVAPYTYNWSSISRSNLFSGVNTTQNITFNTTSTSSNKTSNIIIHSFDNIPNITIGQLTGYDNNGNYPINVSIYVNNSLNYRLYGKLIGNRIELFFLNNSATMYNITYPVPRTRIVYLPLSNITTMNNLSFNITAFTLSTSGESTGILTNYSLENSSATLCGNYTLNTFRLRNATVNICGYNTSTKTGLLDVHANVIDIDENSTINGTTKGFSGGIFGQGGSQDESSPAGKGGKCGIGFGNGTNGNDGSYEGVPGRYSSGGGGACGSSGHATVGSIGASGGAGSSGGNGGVGGNAGNIYDSSLADEITNNSIGTGGGGGGGGGRPSCGGISGLNGTNGTAGGGAIRLNGINVTVFGKLLTTGGNGGVGGKGEDAGSDCLPAGGGGGGGGGSGGTIVISGSIISINNSVINASGGQGGAGGLGGYNPYYGYRGTAGGNGSSGANGFVRIFYSILNNASANITGYYQKLTVGYPSNITVDVLSDGTLDYNITGVFNSSTIVSFSDSVLTGINSYIRTSCKQGAERVCNVPISINSKSIGILQIGSINASYNATNIALSVANITSEQKKNNANYFNLSVKIGSYSNGTIKLSNLTYDYLGYQIFAINATSSQNSTVLYASIYYSGWNYTMPTDTMFLEFLPSSPFQKNVSAFRQTIKTPVFNFTFRNPADLSNYSIRLNESHSCVNLTFLNHSTSNLNDSIVITNTSWTNVFTGVSSNTNGGMWLYAQYSCNSTSGWGLFAPTIFIRGCMYTSTCPEAV